MEGRYIIRQISGWVMFTVCVHCPLFRSSPMWHVNMYMARQKHQNPMPRITRKFCTVEEWCCWKELPCLLLHQAYPLSTSDLITAEGFLCRWGRPHSLLHPSTAVVAVCSPSSPWAVSSLIIMSLYLLVTSRGKAPRQVYLQCLLSSAHRKLFVMK